MILGDHFPREERTKFFRNGFRPGRIYYLHCTFTRPRKNKFVLVACVDPEPVVLLINSRVNEFVQRRPPLARCQVAIDEASHGFLRHDSFIDCSAAFPMDFVEIERQVLDDTSAVRGSASPSVIDQVCAAVKLSSGIARRHREWILVGLC